MYIGLSTAIVGQNNPSLPQIVSSLFSNGEQGAWYDPSDLSTMYQDAAGTIPVTGVGQPVGKILDKSGRGNHATQSTTATRPTLQQESGKYYLSFDGVDDSLVTGNINFTATDKMTVMAGLRKLRDSPIGTVAELSIDPLANNGTFLMTAPAGGGNTFLFGSGGTTLHYGYTPSGGVFAAPLTVVESGIGDIAGDVAKLRINGAQVASSAGDQGTGNYGNFPLYIGRRGGTTTPFNGRLYGLVVRGALSSTAEITSAESYMNTFTRAY